MKKITFLFLFLISGFTASAQFPESFEGATFPPAGWVSFIGANGLGTAQNWASATPAAATVGLDGTKTAFVRWELLTPTTTDLAEDWLVSPLVAITAGNPNLTFSDAQQFTVAYNSVYDVRISTTSQTDMMSFTTVSSRDESALSLIGTVGLTPQTIDLSAYIGQSVYIAFVMTNNDGDNWFLDNVNAGEPLLPCLGNTFMYPFTAVTTGICDGISSTLIANNSWAGDYAEINVVAGETYKFASSVATDYLTISTDGNATAAAFGLQPLTWVSTVTGVVRLNINTDSSCGTEDVDRVTSVICGTPCINGGLWPTATFASATCDGTTVNVIATDSYAAEYSNVQVYALGTYTFASSVATDYITITSADASTIYTAATGSAVYTPTADEVVRVYFHLDSACGAEAVNREKTVVCTSPVSPPNCIDTPPVSPLNGATDVSIDAVLAWNAPSTGEAPTGYNIYLGLTPVLTAADLALSNYPDTTLTGLNAPYDTVVYWMVVPVNAAGEAAGCLGSPWSFTTESAPLPPVNDDCSGAIALTAGNSFPLNDIAATNVGATDSGQAASTCTATVNGDVWYSIVVPSTTLTIETQIADGTITDPVLVAYSGTCGALTEIGCSDDIDFAGGNFLARMDLTGLTIGDTIYFRLYTYGEVGTILLSAWDGTLANTTFDNGTFSAVPNPVKDILNITFSQNIEKVQVMNLLGQEVMTKAINATQSQVDMSSLAQGTYLVKVTADGQVKTIKVIKE
jgi:Secretion system C-terminal sorting domain